MINPNDTIHYFKAKQYPYGRNSDTNKYPDKNNDKGMVRIPVQ